MAYGEPRSPTGAPLFQIRVGEEKPYQFGVNSTTSRTANTASSHNYLASLFDIGIFKDTLAPSLALHSSLAVLAWAAGRATDRVEAKDWLWPSGLVLNAWWSSIGRKVLLEGWSVSRALRLLSWPERLLLTGVTAWGLRLFYRVSSRSVRRGKDDARYESSKKQEGFWNKALVGMFLPEAVFQSVIALPFTAPFRHQGAVLTGYHPYVQMLAVGVFSAGFALEALADYQLEEHRGSAGLMRKGVWSIVRHPKYVDSFLCLQAGLIRFVRLTMNSYLGDTLVHAAFPLLLYASDMLAPIELLGPIANYIFLRYVGGDKENEASQGQQYAKEDSNKNVRTKDKDLLAGPCCPRRDLP